MWPANTIMQKYEPDRYGPRWDEDEDEEWDLKRSLCVHPPHVESTLTSTSAEQLSATFASAHQKCTSRDTVYYGAFNGEPEGFFQGELLPYDWNFYSGILAASRQIYQEALPLFWHTSRFCFEEGDALDEFLCGLTKNQRANLRHVVLCYHFCSYKDTEYVRDPIRTEWLEPMVHKRNSRALGNLDSLELHLQLDGNGDDDYPGASSPNSQSESVEAALKALEDLRLLHPKRAAVTVSYAEYANRSYKSMIRKGEFADIAERFRKRLLDPKITHEDRLERLTDKVKDLKTSLTKEEKAVEEYQEQAQMYQKEAQMFQRLADAGRATAVEMNDNLDELEGLLSRHNAAEIKDFLRV